MTAEDNLRVKILERLKDIEDKITNNIPCPEANQSYELLSGIDDLLEECLLPWNY